MDKLVITSEQAAWLAQVFEYFQIEPAVKRDPHYVGLQEHEDGAAGGDDAAVEE